MNPMNNEELTNLIVKELSKHRDRKDITQVVCERSHLDWKDAEKLVAEVAEKNKRTIAARQSPFLLAVSIVILLAGIGLLAYSIRFFFIFSQESAVMKILSLRSGYYVIGELVTGIGMTGGGLFGAWKTVASVFPD
jgi:hypothetical protein